MKSTFLEQWEAGIPADSAAFARKYADVVERIRFLMQEKGISKKQLAEDLSKNPSEITKWLNGEHNFTMRSLVKLEVELGADIIRVPRSVAVDKQRHQTVHFTLLVNDRQEESSDSDALENDDFTEVGGFIPAYTGS